MLDTRFLNHALAPIVERLAEVVVLGINGAFAGACVALTHELNHDKSATEVFNIVRTYLEKMTREKNQIDSRLVIDDAKKQQVAGSYDEWLVFKSVALYLDQTRFYYVLSVQCDNGKAEVTMSRLHYLYDEYRKPQNIKAEEWITDGEAVNKKNTRLYPNSGKFRRKTIDRKDFIFNKLETLLK